MKAEEQKDKDVRLITKGKASLEYALKLNRWLKKEYQPILEKANQSLISRIF